MKATNKAKNAIIVISDLSVIQGHQNPSQNMGIGVTVLFGD